MSKKRFPIRIMLLSLFFCLLNASFLHAQEDYKKWLQEQKQKYQEFKDQRDKAFADFLQQEWKKMQLMQGLVPDEEPKPENIPVAKPQDFPEHEPPEPPQPVEDIDVPKPVPTVPPPPEIPIPEVKNEQKVDMDFYGVPVTVACDKSIFFNLNDEVSKESIAVFWTKSGTSDYEPLLKQVNNLQKKLGLNDWGLAVLLFHIGEKIYPEHANSNLLFTWFMLSKLGYDVRVGYFGKKIVILIPSDQVLYETTFFNFNEKQYYAVSFSGKPQEVEQLYTYDGNYPGADKTFDFNMGSPPNIGDKKSEKELSFAWNGQTIKLHVEYNRQVVDFLNDYPHTSLDIYFNSLPSLYASYSLLSNLKPYLEGKSEFEAVDFILRFVQNSFQYETDAEQFGREKYLFSEETIFYPYSDCEDRSILFAFLVRKLTGLDIIGLDYPGHIATAIKFNSEIDGDNVVYQNQKYLICDPTYINANVGMCMPQFKNVKPEVIVIKHND